LVEKLIVRKYLTPTLPTKLLKDQYAYRPTGSTTAALVDITHHITLLLETNTYVRCILIDYSKAFDTINHEILFDKLRMLTIPQLIIQWIMNFLTGRTQALVTEGTNSNIIPISRSSGLRARTNVICCVLATVNAAHCSYDMEYRH